MTTTRPAYSEVQKAEAVALSLTVGVVRAAERTGIPRKTISRWRASPSGAVAGVIEATAQDVASRLWEAVTTGTDAVLAGLRDPKTRLSDRAQALRIVVEAHALITGQATSRTETTDLTDPGTAGMTEEEKRALAEFVARINTATDDELREWLMTSGAAVLTGNVPQLEAGDGFPGGSDGE